jgi:hypothetical protein
MDPAVACERLVASARGGPSALLAAQCWTEATDGALASGAHPVALKPQALRGAAQAVAALLGPAAGVSPTSSPLEAVAGAIALSGLVGVVAAASSSASGNASGSAADLDAAAGPTGDQLRELGTACVRATTLGLARAVREVGAAEGARNNAAAAPSTSSSSSSSSASASAIAVPALTAALRGLALLPHVYRRAVPDIVLAACRIARYEGNESVAALAAEVAAAALVLALRGSGKGAAGGAGAGAGASAASASGASSSSSSASSSSAPALHPPPLDLSTPLRWIVASVDAAVAAIAHLGAFAPVTAPGELDALAGLVALLPPDGVAHAKPAEHVLAALAAADAAAPGTTASPSSGGGLHALTLVTARTRALLRVASALLSRRTPSLLPPHVFSAAAAASGHLGFPLLALSPAENAFLPVPALLASVEVLADASSGLVAAVDGVHAGAARAAAADPAWGRALGASAAELVGGGLDVLEAMTEGCAGPLRRYRTHVARVLGRLLRETNGAADAHAQFPQTDAGLLRTRRHACRVLRAWLERTGCGTPTAQSCPEAVILLGRTAEACAARMAAAVWGVGVASDALPLAEAVDTAHAIVASAWSCLPDATRFRVEQAALSLLGAWPASAGGGNEAARRAAAVVQASGGGGAGGDRGGAGAKRPRTARGTVAVAALLEGGAGKRGDGGPFSLSGLADDGQTVSHSAASAAAGGATLFPVMPSGTTAAAALPPTLILAPSVRNRVLGLLALVCATPWSGGSASPLTPLLRMALLSASHAGQGSAGGLPAAIAAAIVAVTASSVSVSAVRVSVPAGGTDSGDGGWGSMGAAPADFGMATAASSLPPSTASSASSSFWPTAAMTGSAGAEDAAVVTAPSGAGGKRALDGSAVAPPLQSAAAGGVVGAPQPAHAPPSAPPPTSYAALFPGASAAGEVEMGAAGGKAAHGGAGGSGSGNGGGGGGGGLSASDLAHLSAKYAEASSDFPEF